MTGRRIKRRRPRPKQGRRSFVYATPAAAKNDIDVIKDTLSKLGLRGAVKIEQGSSPDGPGGRTLTVYGPEDTLKAFDRLEEQDAGSLGD